MIGEKMAICDVKLEPLKDVSMRDFSQFGRVIGRDEDTEVGKYNLHPIDAKPAVENEMIKAYWDLIPWGDKESMTYRFSFGMIFLKAKPIGEPIEWTECHRQTYESFFPLGGKQLIFVMAPKGPVPDPEKTRAFLVGPDEGVMLDKGTWHYPPFSPCGITPCLMPRFGCLAECQGPVTEAYGKKWDTSGPGWIKGALHCVDTPFYGKGYEGEYNIRIIL